MITFMPVGSSLTKESRVLDGPEFRFQCLPSLYRVLALHVPSLYTLLHASFDRCSHVYMYMRMQNMYMIILCVHIYIYMIPVPVPICVYPCVYVSACPWVYMSI